VPYTVPQALTSGRSGSLTGALTREGGLTGVDVGVNAGERLRLPLFPEQFLALDEHPDSEGEERERADTDRHVHQQQPAGGHPSNKNPDGDDDQRGAEPDHLPVISSCPGAPAMLGA
jgi:hypothetical protein